MSGIQRRMMKLLVEQNDLDTLRYGPITGPEAAYTDRPVRRFRKGWQNIDLKPFPANSSDETVRELDAILFAQRALDSLPPDSPLIADLHAQDVDFEGFFVDFLRKEGVEFSRQDVADFDDLTTELATVSQYHKLKYDRPRPKQLADIYGIPLRVLDSEVAKTPAYPSGHSFAGRFLSRLYGDLFPVLRPKLEALAEEIGLNRIRAGLHFPSDHAAGVRLADALYPLFKG